MTGPFHLFVDISSHGFGHLAITAPVLNALAERCPGLRLTLRTALPGVVLRRRLRPPFTLVATASDFGYVMRDALTIDLDASAAAYRQAHADWPRRVNAEAAWLAALAPDGVLSNVSYLPLAGAAQAGIPAAALCSLNWADLFAHFFGNREWAAAIHAEILAAYRSAALFLRATPGMPMADLGNVVSVGPIAARGKRCDLGLGAGVRSILVALGGIAHRLPVDAWPRLQGIRWLVPAAWNCRHPDALASESLGLDFPDLVASVDALIGKPGYGTFTEAACNGTPVLFQRRDDWPEQACLIDWLQEQGPSREVSGAALASGQIAGPLGELLAFRRSSGISASGGEAAAEQLLQLNNGQVSRPTGMAITRA